MAEQAVVPTENSKDTIIMRTLMELTCSMWKVAGEGSGGISRDFGEQIWKLTDEFAPMLGEAIDKSSLDTAMESLKKYFTESYNIAGEMDYSIKEDTIEMTVKNCVVQEYTDYLEANEVPRSAGCIISLITIAMIEEITGDPFIIDSIKNKDGTCKIVMEILGK